MNKNERPAYEYMVMNPLIQEGMEPAYEWYSQNSIDLTFPNEEEYIEGLRVLSSIRDRSVIGVFGYPRTYQVMIQFTKI